MKIRNLVGSLLLCCICFSCEQTGKEKDMVAVHFATKVEAEKLIVAEDDFSKNLNQFDLNVRLQKSGATKEEWETLVKRETMVWTKEEQKRMNLVFDTLEANISKMGLDIPFPDEIVMVKTSMKEELGAGGYTRNNWIAIGENELKMATDAQLAQLVAHEVFHVLSRFDSDFKKDVYKIFGFVSTGREFMFAKDAVEKRITNPDIARRDSYIPLTVGGEKRNCVEYIYADHEYAGGDIFDCLRVGFIPLDEEMQPLTSDTGTVIYPISVVANEFQSKIGKNTGYVIDPEEISAEHFSFLVTNKKNLPNPEYIEKMKEILQKGDD